MYGLINRIRDIVSPQRVTPNVRWWKPPTPENLVTFRPLRVEQFVPWMLDRVPLRPIYATVLHSRLPLDAANWWEGAATLEYWRQRDMERWGAVEIHGNAVCDPEGYVWGCRPLDWPGTGYGGSEIVTSWDYVPLRLRELAYDDRLWLNKHAVSVAAVGRFDERPADPLPLPLEVAFRVLAAVHVRFGIPPERLFLHYEFAYKPNDDQCPGRGIRPRWAHEELAARMGCTRTPMYETAAAEI